MIQVCKMTDGAGHRKAHLGKIFLMFENSTEEFTWTPIEDLGNSFSGNVRTLRKYDWKFQHIPFTILAAKPGRLFLSQSKDEAFVRILDTYFSLKTGNVTNKYGLILLEQEMLLPIFSTGVLFLC